MQGCQSRYVLLDDENDGLAEIVDLPAHLLGGVLVEIVVHVGERGRVRISRRCADTDIVTGGGVARSTDKSFVDALLSSGMIENDE